MSSESKCASIVLPVRVGDEVLIGDDVEATVNQICIQAQNRVTYEVVWWNGRQRCSDWVCEHEIHRVATRPGPMGFAIQYKD